MTRRILSTLTLTLILLTTAARGDGLLFSYDGDVFPDDPAGGFTIANVCEPGCSRRVENGHFLLEWDEIGDLVNYDHLIGKPAAALPRHALGRVAIPIQPAVAAVVDFLRRSIQGQFHWYQ